MRVAIVDGDADRVDDEELLYRRLTVGLGYKRLPDGQLRISASAFADRGRRPSVDRAKLRDNDPSLTRLHQTDAVASLIAAQVRHIQVSTNDSDGKPILAHAVDVEPVPLDENPAHAEIFALPFPDKDKTFERIRTSLAQLARWEIEPLDT